MLLSNLAWTLGNGETINFLSDIWVPALGPLYDYVQLPPSSMHQISFASVLNDRGEWDVAQLSTVFMATAVPYILGIKPPGPNSGPDMCVWRWTDHQDFVLKSAYQQCVQPVLGWLRQNLYSNILFRGNLPWKLVFSSILWHTWKNRNDAIFTGISCTFEQVLSRGIAWANYYNDGWMTGALVTHSTMIPTPWSNPEPGCFCLNIDGAVSLNSGKATIVGLLRDAAGNFLFGFSKFIGCVNSLNAELWSLYIGLQLVWDYGIDYLEIQTDCK
ncbi:hypothetical protein V6N11_028581 [Hibiscus sabdariffa]|uniref:RNase H type-1 domain-containing protein n=1 Tax=Hibiscus sabdariffa TaxID=183260 RepID=A0ABR2NAA9_9ROSI